MNKQHISIWLIVIVLLLWVLPWFSNTARRNMTLWAQTTISSILGKSYTLSVKDQIEQNLRRLYEANPENPDLILAYAMLEDSPQLAIDALRGGIEKNEYDLNLNYYYGLVRLGATGLAVEPDFEEAQEIFSKMEVLNPTNGAHNIHLARALLASKDTINAIDELNQAINKKVCKFFYVDMTYKTIKVIKENMGLSLFERMVLFISMDMERFDYLTTMLLDMLPKLDPNKPTTPINFTEEDRIKAQLIYDLGLLFSREVSSSVAAEVSGAILRQEAANSLTMVEESLNRHDKSLIATYNRELAYKHRYLLNQLMPETIYKRYKDRGNLWLILYLAVWQAMIVLPIYLLILSLQKKDLYIGYMGTFALLIPIIGIPIYWLAKLIGKKRIAKKASNLDNHVSLVFGLFLIWMTFFWMGNFGMKSLQDKAEDIAQMDIISQEYSIPIETHYLQDVLGISLY